MNVAVCSVQIRFPDQDAFICPFDSYDCNHVEYSEEAESIEAWLEGVFQDAIIYRQS